MNAGELPIEVFLKAQPRSVLNRLYEKPASCLAVFRLLPMVARQVIMDMLFLDGPLAIRDCLRLFRQESAGEYTVPVQRMEHLSIIMTRDGDLYMNDIFKKGITGALNGSGDCASFGTPCTPSKSDREKTSVEFLDEYARKQWETILYFMVGSEQTPAPRNTVLFLLQRAGLMQRDSDTMQLSITSAGFQFLLQDINSQLWVLLLQYLRMTEERNMDLVEVLAFFFTVGGLEVGRAYEAKGFSLTQLQTLEELSDYGLVYRPSKAAKYFFPTRLAATLTSTASPLLSSLGAQEAQGYVILETNYRIYAYTSNLLRIAILNLFITLKSRLPNLVVGQLTRDSVKAALKKGITAAQVIAYLSHHAHPQMYKNDPLLPATVSDQIRLWEREKNRVATSVGNLYAEFTSSQDYEQVRDYAQSLGVLQWSSDAKRMFFVAAEGHENVREFIQRRRV